MNGSRSFYYPLATYHPSDGGEYNIRDHAGQSGRFCVIGTHTVDIMGSFKTMKEAKAYVEWRAGPGEWEKQ